MTPNEIERMIKNKADSYEVTALKTEMNRLQSELSQAQRVALRAENTANLLARDIRNLTELLIEYHQASPGYTLAADPQGFVIDRLLSLKERIG